MIALIQRVAAASVVIEQQTVAAISKGLLALIGIEASDTPDSARRLLHKLLHYRVFADATGRMNTNLQTVQGGLLLVPQFTLAADTTQGLRPGFSRAAPPAQAQALFAELYRQAQFAYASVACGQFGAHMQVSLINDGPVTFWLQVD